MEPRGSNIRFVKLSRGHVTPKGVLYQPCPCILVCEKCEINLGLRQRRRKEGRGEKRRRNRCPKKKRIEEEEGGGEEEEEEEEEEKDKKV